MRTSPEERRVLRALVWLAAVAAVGAMALPDVPQAHHPDAALAIEDSVGGEDDVILWDTRADTIGIRRDSTPTIPHIVGRGCFQ
jgi:hypothetical protein